MKKSDYPSPIKISNSQLDKIGNRIRSKQSSESDMRNLDSWRASHLYPMNTFRTTLMEKTKGMNGRIVAQRLKRLPTIIHKLSHENKMCLSRMQDVGGLRAIVKTNREVYKLADYYNSKKLSHPIKRFNDYIKNPKSSGYRSIHIVFEYKSTQSRNVIAKEYDGLLLELQLRTELQHLWATSVEIAGLMQDQKLKNSLGNSDWLEFFMLVSEVFAEIEAVDEPEYLQSKMSPEEAVIIFKRIKKLDSEKKILEHLRAFSAGVNLVEDGSGRGKYAIIALDLRLHKVHIFKYSEKNYDQALEKYASLEKSEEYTDQVLVTVGALKQLKRAYPNYFVDIKKFIERVKGMIDEISDI